MRESLISTRITLRLVLFVVVVAGLALLLKFSPLAEFLREDRLLLWVETLQGLWWAAIILVLLYIVFGVSGIPSAPLLVAGALFGPLYGTLYNVLGLLAAATASFFLARALGRDFVVHVARGRFFRAQRFLTRFGFWPLVQARFLPIPDTVVNYCAALAGVPARIFLFASLIGLLPSTLIHTVFISELIVPQVSEARIMTGAYYLGIFVCVNLLIGGPWLLSQWRRRQRYLALRECLRLRRQASSEVAADISASISKTRL